MPHKSTPVNSHYLPSRVLKQTVIRVKHFFRQQIKPFSVWKKKNDELKGKLDKTTARSHSMVMIAALNFEASIILSYTGNTYKVDFEFQRNK